MYIYSQDAVKYNILLSLTVYFFCKLVGNNKGSSPGGRVVVDEVVLYEPAWLRNVRTRRFSSSRLLVYWQVVKQYILC